MRELKGMFDYSVVGDERFSVELSAEQPESGIELVHMKLHSDEAVAPTQLKLCFGVGRETVNRNDERKFINIFDV